MKFSFKRILSSALAAVMAASVMSVGMVSSVMAADYENGTVSEEALKKTWGFKTNMPSGSNTTLKVNDTVNGIIFDNVGGGCNLNKGNYISIKAGAVFRIPVPADCTGNIYVLATSGNSDRNVSFTDSSNGEASGEVTKTMIMNTSTTDNSQDFTSYATSDGYIKLTAAGGECKIGMIQITLTSGSFTTAQDTYKITGNVSGLKASETFTLGDYTATVDEGGSTYTVTKSVDQGTDAPFTTGQSLEASKANYKVNDKASETVTITGTDKEFTATPDLVFAEDITYQTAIPTDTGYTFTGEGRLPLKDGAEGGAYADENSATLTNHIQISEGKAKLVDQSSSTTTMNLPLTEKISGTTTGKVVIKGTISELAATGSKWNVLNFKDAAGNTIVDLRVASPDDQNNTPAVGKGIFALAVDSGNKSTDGKNTTLYNYYPTTVTCEDNGSYDYAVTFDYDADSVTLEIGSGKVTVTSDQEESLATMGGVGTIVAMTAGSNSREFALSNITVLIGTAATNTQIASGDDYYATDAANTYIIHPVTEDELAYSSLALEGAEAKTSTEKVYKAVQFADGSQITAEEVGATSLFAICVTGTTGAAPSSDVFEWVNNN